MLLTEPGEQEKCGEQLHGMLMLCHLSTARMCTMYGYSVQLLCITSTYHLLGQKLCTYLVERSQEIEQDGCIATWGSISQ